MKERMMSQIEMSPYLQEGLEDELSQLVEHLFQVGDLETVL
jgi:hypothetical protein